MNLIPSERETRLWWSRYYARQNTPRTLGRRLADIFVGGLLVVLEDARALRRTMKRKDGAR